MAVHDHLSAYTSFFTWDSVTSTWAIYDSTGVNHLDIYCCPFCGDRLSNMEQPIATDLSGSGFQTIKANDPVVSNPNSDVGS